MVILNSSESCAELVNHGTHSTIDIEVGTPGQTFSVVADTGSDDVIVPSCVCKDSRGCSSKNRCFKGEGMSSTFRIDDGKEGPPIATITFGSGPVDAAIATDVVRIGEIEAMMQDSVFLMVNNELDFPGPFEGLLGLGPPVQVISADAESQVDIEKVAAEAAAAEVARALSNFADVLKQEVKDSVAEGLAEGQAAHAVAQDQEDVGAPFEMHTSLLDANRSQGIAARQPQRPRSFMQQAGVPRFSMCFNDAESGVFRLSPPVASNSMGSIGTSHWGLDFRGFSVGASDEPLPFCGMSDMREGQKTPCGGIPDSGTTFLMGPQEHVDILMAGLCDGWSRCSNNYTLMLDTIKAAEDTIEGKYHMHDPFGIRPLAKHEVFQLLLHDCETWLDESMQESAGAGLAELPPLRLTLVGAGGEEQVLELPSWTYVLEMLSDETESAVRVCSAALGVTDYTTAANGPVWILGTPLFYAYEIGYDLEIAPGSMSFRQLSEENPCGTCEEGSTMTLAAVAERRRSPRRVRSSGWRSSVDTRSPL